LAGFLAVSIEAARLGMMLMISWWLPAGEVLYADVLLLPNGMSKVGFYE
jgi:hypothetical protein